MSSDDEELGEVVAEMESPIENGEKPTNVPDEYPAPEETTPDDVETVSAVAAMGGSPSGEHEEPNGDEKDVEPEPDTGEYDYQTLKEETAFQLHTGIISPEQVTVPEVAAEDGIDQHTLLTDAKEYLENNTPEAELVDDDDEDLGHTSDPAAIDWRQLYEQFDNIDVGKPQSRTQWQLIIEVSDQTPAGEAVASQIVEQAITSGILALRGRGKFQPNWDKL